MKVLFDQNVPAPLAGHLAKHDFTRAKQLGWEELKNGNLLKSAEERGFDVLVTCDQNLEYQQQINGRGIAIVALSTNNWPLLRERLAVIAEAVNRAGKETFQSVDCGKFRSRRTLRGMSGPEL